MTVVVLFLQSVFVVASLQFEEGELSNRTVCFSAGTHSKSVRSNAIWQTYLQIARCPRRRRLESWKREKGLFLLVDYDYDRPTRRERMLLCRGQRVLANQDQNDFQTWAAGVSGAVDSFLFNLPSTAYCFFQVDLLC